MVATAPKYLLVAPGSFDGDRVKYDAHLAVRNAMRRGAIRKATEYPCQKCGNQARDFHHCSYYRNDALNVIPLCKTCHQRHHKCGLQLPALGIVVLPTGVIRIAIANVPL